MTIKIDAFLEQLKENSVIRDRKIYICDEVTRESMFKAVYSMNRLKDLDDQDNVPIKDRKPIEIVLDCYGGYVTHGLSLISTILSFKELGYHVIITVHSVAMSMGWMILCVGSERRALKHSYVMLHQLSSGTIDTYQGMKESIEQSEKMWYRMRDIVIEHTKITNEQLDDITARKFDWYMWSEEALKLGVIDKII